MGNASRSTDSLEDNLLRVRECKSEIVSIIGRVYKFDTTTGELTNTDDTGDEREGTKGTAEGERRLATELLV